MIVVIGSRTDKVIHFFASRLEPSQREKFCFIDQDLFGTYVHIDDQSWYLASGRVIKHREVSGVWNRLVDIGQRGFDVKQHIEQFSCYLMDEIYPKVLSRPKDGMSNYAKQYQIDLVKLERLKKIDSHVCANTRLEWGISGYEIIRKSMSGIRSIVTKVSDKDKKRWVKEPVLFQKYVEGLNIRVHVVENSVFACGCYSKAVDYRYGKALKIKTVKLPKWVEEECLSISRQLRLPFSGIDLIKKAGSYYLLEVNPAPGYAYFDVDGSISRALSLAWG